MPSVKIGPDETVEYDPFRQEFYYTYQQGKYSIYKVMKIAPWKEREPCPTCHRPYEYLIPSEDWQKHELDEFIRESRERRIAWEQLTYDQTRVGPIT
jgi:hypothetical protein